MSRLATIPLNVLLSVTCYTAMRMCPEMADDGDRPTGYGSASQQVYFAVGLSEGL